MAVGVDVTDVDGAVDAVGLGELLPWLGEVCPVAHERLYLAVGGSDELFVRRVGFCGDGYECACGAGALGVLCPCGAYVLGGAQR